MASLSVQRAGIEQPSALVFGSTEACGGRRTAIGDPRLVCPNDDTTGSPHFRLTSLGQMT